MNKQQTNGKDISSILRLPVGPGVDRAATLEAIDQAVGRIERILSDMEASDRRNSMRNAFERFMLELAPSLAELGSRIRIRHNASWIKIESLVNGHKVYVSKGKLAVGRVDSTLPPELVTGARVAGKYNGRIASWLSADKDAVETAIMLLGSELVRPLKK